jgi:hypothetical protein
MKINDEQLNRYIAYLEKSIEFNSDWPDAKKVIPPLKRELKACIERRDYLWTGIKPVKRSLARNLLNRLIRACKF